MKAIAQVESWCLAPCPLVLEQGDVHVWRAQLDLSPAELARLRQILTAEELSQAERFRFAVHRDRFVAGRAVLREILGRYKGTHPRRLSFRYSDCGKPCLQEEPAAGIHFNLAHADGVGLFAFARGREVGVDVERLQHVPHAELIAARHFSAAEKEAFRRVVPDLREEAFLTCWTLKEALVKGLGCGLSAALDKIDVGLTPAGSWRLLEASHGLISGERWLLRSLQLSPGFVGALAVEGEGLKLVCWEWTAPM